MNAKRMNIPEQLIDLVRKQSTQQATPGISALADAARAVHGDSVKAVLFYGSCLRTGNVRDGLADLYLLVDDYHAAFKSHTLAFLNWLLPPNVFYLEIPYEGDVLRAKYAVLTLDDFCKGTKGWFHSYIWGRFSQQSGLVYAQDESIAHQVQLAMAQAVTTFITKTVPQMDQEFSARDLWIRGLSLSYRAELRTEQPDGSARLYDANPDYYEEITYAAIPSTPYNVKEIGENPHRYEATIPVSIRRLNRLNWRLRAFQGKILSALRLSKALLTFKGGVNYILWKIERHSGVRVEVSPGLKRFPPLAVIVIFWRLYRQDAFR